jgi:predicted ATP-grasp superfamily ATP-dependent carboligase
VVPDLSGLAVRDIPHPGERIAARRPICTLVASGGTPESVLAELETRAAELPVGAHALA